MSFFRPERQSGWEEKKIIEKGGQEWDMKNLSQTKFPQQEGKMVTNKRKGYLGGRGSQSEIEGKKARGASGLVRRWERGQEGG